jgi:DMSO reductase family type II enzyme heme b subunit
MKTLLRSVLVAALYGAAISAMAADEGLQAPRIAGSAPILDVNASFWEQAKAVPVPMLPQVVALPTNPKNAVAEIQVQAMYNDHWLALRLEWKDTSESDRIVVDQFGDQVAVEFPVDYKPDAPPSPMMGNPGGRVNILQWRAAFQHDIDAGPPEVKTLYPNAIIDFYPDQVLRATDARAYTGALGVDNPVSRPKQSPVLDQMAEGWGSMTVKADQHADGKGVWKDGIWSVVITTPLGTESLNAPHFEPGTSTVVAFAVWEGGNREVGSRKAWSIWLPLTLAK